MTRPKVSASRKCTSELHQTPAASLRHFTITCSWLSSALTNPLPYLSEAESLLNYLVSTVWSRTDSFLIDSLKEHTSVVTQTHIASGCLAAPSNARRSCENFKSFPFQFPYKDTCLTRNTPTILKEMSKMHEADTHDDNLIPIETSNQIHARA